MMRAALAVAVSLAISAPACRDHDAPPARASTAAIVRTPGGPPGTADLVPVPPAIASGVALREIATGLKRPVLLTFAPDDARRRLFVIEQRGAIRILEHGVLAPTPMFDIRGHVSTDNEQGLLGLAFHPKFATNRKLYVDFTAPDGNTHIVEYQVSATDPDTVDMSTARELVEIDKLYPNHNGGNLLFGPDGKLYVGTGDGGAGGDPHKNGQNPTALLAKILRFDVDAPGTPVPELVHLGVRNPWRYWFDRPTGDLYIGDVGQDLWENVYVVGGDDHRRHNFGWNIVEGAHCFNAATCDRSPFTPPVVDYPHTEGCSITGGVVYRGRALPALVGRYFYADYCTGLLRSFVWTRDPAAAVGAQTGWIRDHWDWKAAIDRDGVLAQVSSFGVDADGEMYLVLLTGSILEVVPATASATPAPAKT